MIERRGRNEGLKWCMGCLIPTLLLHIIFPENLYLFIILLVTYALVSDMIQVSGYLLAIELSGSKKKHFFVKCINTFD